MSKLYELSKELAVINDELITADGEITPELETRLDQVNLALTEKATGIRKWFSMIETDGDALDTEIKRLQRIKKQNENLQDRLKAYVKKNMEIADKKKLDTPIGTFTICKSPDSMEIVVPELIPDTFKDVVPEHKEINNTRIKKAFSEGYDVPGAKLITDRSHLRVK